MKAIGEGDYNAGSKELRYTKVNEKHDPDLQQGMENRSDMRKNIWDGKD
jgi:hypothetical protein